MVRYLKIAALVLALAALSISGFVIWIVWRLPQKSLLVKSVAQRQDSFQLAARLRVDLSSECPWTEAIPQTPVGFMMGLYSTPEANKRAVLEVSEKLIENGCSVDQYSFDGYTPLLEAILFNRIEAVRFLLDHGADPKLRIREIGKKSGSDTSPVGIDAVEFATHLSRLQTSQDRSAIVLALARSPRV